MKRRNELVVLVVAALFIVQPVLTMAASPVRVIPAGKVSVLSDGKEVSQFKSEMPLPQGSMMACDGKCLVQTQGLQLVARDKAVFALSETQSRWDLAVKTGEIDFAIGVNAKQIAFHTAHDLIQVQEAIIPASSEGLVRGTIVVTESQTRMTVTQGALRVVGHDGEQLVQSGQIFTLAQHELAPKQTTSEQPGKKPGGVIDKGSGNPGPGGLFGLSREGTIGLMVGTAVTLGLGFGLAFALDDDGDEVFFRSEVSPFF